MNALRKHIFFLLLLCGFQVGIAQQDSVAPFKRFAIKYSPTSYVLSQLPLCSDLPLNFEYRITAHDALIIGAQASIPKLGFFILGGLFRYDERYVMGGGRATIAYRRYLYPFKWKEPGLYVGVEIGVAGYTSRKEFQVEHYSESNGWKTLPHRLKGIMSNYNFTIGYEMLMGKAVVDMGISIGARYHYFWRQYEYGNLELNRDAGSLYSYFKKSPLGGSINCSIGGLF